MPNLERREAILAILRKSGAATVDELAEKLYVSEATVRRDLAEMQSMGQLRRSHGGAVLLETADEVSILVRMSENAGAKTQVATKAVKQLPSDFKTVFLDSSSTVLAAARLMNLSDKTVVTNSLQAIVELSRIRDINLIVPGGTVSPRGHSICGSWTARLVSEFRFDLMLSSCAAIDTNGAYETSIEQREIKRTVFNCSAVRMLLVDHTKFEMTGPYLFEPLAKFDMIVFDELSEERRAALRGLPVIV